MKIQELAKLSPITLALLVAIVGYFVLQMGLGVSADNPTNDDLVRFGANFLPLTIDEPYRLLSAGFVHIGVMHLLFNGFALYSFGQFAEIAWGKWRFLAVFLLSIVGGNLLNLYHTWYGLPEGGLSIAGGASGGIMGLGAGLLILSLSHHRMARLLDKKSLFMIMAINLIMGFAIEGIDNAGHIGGAITGLMLGASLAFAPKIMWALSVVMAVGFGVAFWWLQGVVVACLGEVGCVLYQL